MCSVVATCVSTPANREWELVGISKVEHCRFKRQREAAVMFCVAVKQLCDMRIYNGFEFVVIRVEGHSDRHYVVFDLRVEDKCYEVRVPFDLIKNQKFLQHALNTFTAYHGFHTRLYQPRGMECLVCVVEWGGQLPRRIVFPTPL